MGFFAFNFSTYVSIEYALFYVAIFSFIIEHASNIRKKSVIPHEMTDFLILLSQLFLLK